MTPQKSTDLIRICPLQGLPRMSFSDSTKAISSSSGLPSAVQGLHVTCHPKQTHKHKRHPSANHKTVTRCIIVDMA